MVMMVKRSKKSTIVFCSRLLRAPEIISKLLTIEQQNLACFFFLRKKCNRSRFFAADINENIRIKKASILDDHVFAQGFSLDLLQR